MQTVLSADALKATHWYHLKEYAKHDNGYWYYYNEVRCTWELSWAFNRGGLTSLVLQLIEEN